MTTLYDLPVEIFYSNILPHLFENVSGKELISYSTINKFWYTLIYSNGFTNILFKKLNKTNITDFRALQCPIDKMKTLYLHKYDLGIVMTPMANCVYDAIVTNNLDIKGNIDKIELIRNQNSFRIIEENLMEKYDTLNIEKVNISVDLKFTPQDYLFKFTLNIYQKNGTVIEDELFSTSRPKFYTFKIYGFCRINECTVTSTMK
jgi:hypothetical protein